jgi:hypothetical protein
METHIVTDTEAQEGPEEVQVGGLRQELLSEEERAWCVCGFSLWKQRRDPRKAVRHMLLVCYQVETGPETARGLEQGMCNSGKTFPELVETGRAGVSWHKLGLRRAGLPDGNRWLRRLKRPPGSPPTGWQGREPQAGGMAGLSLTHTHTHTHSHIHTHAHIHTPTVITVCIFNILTQCVLMHLHTHTPYTHAHAICSHKHLCTYTHTHTHTHLCSPYSHMCLLTHTFTYTSALPHRYTHDHIQHGHRHFCACTAQLTCVLTQSHTQMLTSTMLIHTYHILSVLTHAFFTHTHTHTFTVHGTYAHMYLFTH